MDTHLSVAPSQAVRLGGLLVEVCRTATLKKETGDVSFKDEFNAVHLKYHFDVVINPKSLTKYCAVFIVALWNRGVFYPAAHPTLNWPHLGCPGAACGWRLHTGQHSSRSNFWFAPKPKELRHSLNNTTKKHKDLEQKSEYFFFFLRGQLVDILSFSGRAAFR